MPTKRRRLEAELRDVEQELAMAVRQIAWADRQIVQGEARTLAIKDRIAWAKQWKERQLAAIERLEAQREVVGAEIAELKGGDE